MNAAARLLPRVAVALAAAALVAACGSPSAPKPTPAVTAAPTPSPAPSPTPSLGPTMDPFAGVLPLPEDLRLPKGDFAVTPDSPRGMAIGLALPFDLGHCGLYSPVDLDGSLWEPIGALDPAGGPIDTDEEVGQLINATPGEVLLVTSGRLDWRATQGVGVVVVYQRLPGPRSYPGCM